MEPEDSPGRWIATASALVTMLLAFGTVAVYFYGRAQPIAVEVAIRATLDAEANAVWQLLADPSQRPSWRPIDRVGRIDDDAEGHEVWRELDASGDRFDFAILERHPPHRIVIAVASVDQIGMDGRWVWEVSEGAEHGSVVVLTEATSIENPLWRGLNRLTHDPFDTVEMEVGLLADHLGSPAHIERL